MQRIRAGLLFAGVALFAVLGISHPLVAQVAPTLTGESGLFELTNADSLPQGRFSFGLFFSQADRSGAPSLLYGPGADDPLRYGTGKLGVTMGYGLLPNWEATITAGQHFYYADTRDWSGVINGHDRQGGLRHSETDKIRIGTKVLLNPRIDPVKIVVFGGFWIPTQTKADQNALSTYRADWDFGVSGTYGITTFQASYINTADYGEDFDVANEFRWGLGFNIPIIPRVLRGIAEINRVHYDGGTTKPGDFSEVLAGARFALGETGLTASGALRVNIDQWVKYGLRPSPIGGLVQLAYSPAMPATLIVSAPAAATAPEPAPLTTTTTETVTTTPPPVIEPPPAARPETTTTDEILFDTAKSRLTNIAKAILDGVALRLKNNLAATCTVIAFTDPKEKGGDHMGLARARAEAAKDYLVKRHGIDGARIRLDSKGDAEAGPDVLRNRRAVVTVTFP